MKLIKRLIYTSADTGLQLSNTLLKIDKEDGLNGDTYQQFINNNLISFVLFTLKNQTSQIMAQKILWEQAKKIEMVEYLACWLPAWKVKINDS